MFICTKLNFLTITNCGFWFGIAERTSAADLSNIVYFTTGCTTVPPLGFQPKPQLHFLHESQNKFPKTNTCSCVLHLPVVHTDYNQFKSDMDFAILNSCGFGLA